MLEVCSMSTLKTLKRSQSCSSGVFIVSFEQITHCSAVSIVTFEQVNIGWPWEYLCEKFCEIEQ